MIKIKTQFTILMLLLALDKISAQQVSDFQIITTTAPGQFTANGDSLFTFYLVIPITDTTGMADTSKVFSFDVKMQDKKETKNVFDKNVRMEKDPKFFTNNYRIENGNIYISLGNYPATRNYDIDVNFIDNTGVRRKEMKNKY